MSWLRKPKLPMVTLVLVAACVVGLCAFLEANGADDRLRNANIAFANIAICSLALATLWPYSVPPRRLITKVAHHFLFVGYFGAFCHYVCSFALLADPDYLGFAKAHPLGVVLAIFGSLFVVVLSVQCLSADGKVKAFAIKINGVILLVFLGHQGLLNYEAVLAARGAPLPPDVVIALATFTLCALCFASYVVATVRRLRRASAVHEPVVRDEPLAPAAKPE